MANNWGTPTEHIQWVAAAEHAQEVARLREKAYSEPACPACGLIEGESIIVGTVVVQHDCGYDVYDYPEAEDEG